MANENLFANSCDLCYLTEIYLDFLRGICQTSELAILYYDDLLKSCPDLSRYVDTWLDREDCAFADSIWLIWQYVW